jgi:uncharacterized protein (TIGR00730 family)
MMKVGVFCGNASPFRPLYQEDAQHLGLLLGLGKIPIFCGGSSDGLMGRFIQSALDASGKIYAVMTEQEISLSKGDILPFTDLIVVNSIFSQKIRLFQESDAFIALPGGIGTFSEVLDLLLEKQVFNVTKPLILLNSTGYWDHFITLLVQMREEGFIKETDLNFFQIAYSPQEAINFLKKSPTSR